MKWCKNPLKVFTCGLGMFALGALLFNWRLPVLALLGSVALGSAFGYLMIQKLQPRRHMLSNTLVTGVIAFLLINPALAFSFEALAWSFLGTVLVILAKLGPKFKGQLIFNPAALGLLILTTLLFLFYGGEALLPIFVSWWGTDYASPYPLLLLLPLVFYAAYKFRKLYLLFSFLAFNAVWLVVASGLSALYYPYTSGMIYFLAGVMLLEPKTSPVKPYWQIGAALVGLLVYRLAGPLGLGNVELWAIISVNLVGLLSRVSKLKLNRNLKSKHA